MSSRKSGSTYSMSSWSQTAMAKLSTEMLKVERKMTEGQHTQHAAHEGMVEQMTTALLRCTSRLKYQKGLEASEKEIDT